MSLKTYSSTTLWVIIATDHTGQRGFFTHSLWWKGNRRVSKNIRFAMTFPTKEQAQHMVDQWIGTQVNGVEYKPVTIRTNMKKGGSNSGRQAQDHG